jgi:hypothetical protein
LVGIFEALGAGNAGFSVKGNVNEGDTPQAAIWDSCWYGWYGDDSLNGDAGSGAGLLDDWERSSLAHSIRSSIIDRALEADEFRLHVESCGALPIVLPREGPRS